MFCVSPAVDGHNISDFSSCITLTCAPTHLSPIHSLAYSVFLDWKRFFFFSHLFPRFPSLNFLKVFLTPYCGCLSHLTILLIHSTTLQFVFKTHSFFPYPSSCVFPCYYFPSTLPYPVTMLRKDISFNHKKIYILQTLPNFFHLLIHLSTNNMV